MLNKVMLIGYVGADSEMKFTAAGIILTRPLSRVIAPEPRRTRPARDDARDNGPNLFFIDTSNGR